MKQTQGTGSYQNFGLDYVNYAQMFPAEQEICWK